MSLSVSCIFLKIRRPPRSTRTDTLFPYTTLFRSRTPLLIRTGIARVLAISKGLVRNYVGPAPGTALTAQAVFTYICDAWRCDMMRNTTLNLPDALVARVKSYAAAHGTTMTAIRSEEHTSELQSLMRISYAVFCLQKKT